MAVLKNFLILLFLFILFDVNAQVTKMPAYPLITHDPYFSIWSFTDTLNQSNTKHWTGSEQPLIGLVKVDNTVYNFLGKPAYPLQWIAPTSEQQPHTSKYTTSQPAGNWANEDFNDAAFITAMLPFGDTAAHPATIWNTKEIWVRRTFEVTDTDFQQLVLSLRNDDDAEIYINGIKIFSAGWSGDYRLHNLPDSIMKILHRGKNVLAMHCTNTGGGAWLDAGLATQTFIENIQPAQQTALNVTATQTTYSFNCGVINLNVDFLSPLLAKDLDMLSRPVSFIHFRVTSTDKISHHVNIFFAESSAVAGNKGDELMNATSYQTKNLNVLKCGTVAQPVLKKKGDDVRINWGYTYLAVPKQQRYSMKITSIQSIANDYLKTGLLSSLNKNTITKNILLATDISLNTNNDSTNNATILLGYDDIYSIEYFNQNMQAWWKKNFKSMDDLLETSAQQYQNI